MKRKEVTQVFTSVLGTVIVIKSNAIAVNNGFYAAVHVNDEAFKDVYVSNKNLAELSLGLVVDAEVEKTKIGNFLVVYTMQRSTMNGRRKKELL